LSEMRVGFRGLSISSNACAQDLDFLRSSFGVRNIRQLECVMEKVAGSKNQAHTFLSTFAVYVVRYIEGSIDQKTVI